MYVEFITFDSNVKLKLNYFLVVAKSQKEFLVSLHDIFKPCDLCNTIQNPPYPRNSILYFGFEYQNECVQNAMHLVQSFRKKEENKS